MDTSIMYKGEYLHLPPSQRVVLLKDKMIPHLGAIPSFNWSLFLRIQHYIPAEHFLAEVYGDVSIHLKCLPYT